MLSLAGSTDGGVRGSSLRAILRRFGADGPGCGGPPHRTVRLWWSRSRFRPNPLWQTSQANGLGLQRLECLTKWSRLVNVRLHVGHTLPLACLFKCCRNSGYDGNTSPQWRQACIRILLFTVPSRVAGREDGSYWSTGTAICGATVECPRIAAWGNGTRSETTRRDGRVFAKLRNFPHKSTCCRNCGVEGNAEKWRLPLFLYRQLSMRCMPEEGSDWLNLELLRCDWLNLELLRCDWLNLELLRYDWSSDTLLWLVESRAPSLWLVESRAPSLWLVMRYSALIGWHTRAPSLWLVESRAPSLWLVESRPLGGATVKGPQIAPQRNGIRISTTRRDGRVFAKLRNFPHKSTRNEGARLLCRALHAGRKALIGWHTRAPSLWLVESRAPCTRYPQTDALDWIRSYYSAVRVAILLSGPCRTVMSRLL